MWQQSTFEKIRTILSANDAVEEVVELGSQSDEWSDLDVGILVDSAGFGKFFPSTEWVKQFGDIYALNQSSAPSKGTSRVVFADGSRVDFSISTDRTSFSAEAPAPDAETQATSLANLSNDFKFEAFLAASKLARNDLLIGLHLILELERKCLVIAMMLRDRELGTTHHRTGGPFNEVLDDLESHGNARKDLLARLQSAVELFEKLSSDLKPDKRQDWQPLERYVAQVRSSLKD